MCGTVAAEELCIRLKWFHQAQFAGFYVAKERGYYDHQDLQVRFLEGGPEMDWQKEMKEGPCPLGVVNASDVVIGVSRQSGIKAVAAINQVSPIVWFALSKSGIHDPRQFAGKKVVLVPTGKMQFSAMMDRVGVPLSRIHVMPFSLDLTPLYTGEIDVWSGYHTNLVTRAERDGYSVQVIHPMDYGVEIYDDVIYARTDLIEKDAGRLTRFLDATLKGWAHVIRNPEDGLEDTMKYTPGEDRAFQAAFLRRMIPYVHTGEVPIGWMEAGRWEETCKMAQSLGLVPQAPSANAVFTDQFLRQLYPEMPP